KGAFREGPFSSATSLGPASAFPAPTGLFKGPRTRVLRAANEACIRPSVTAKSGIGPKGLKSEGKRVRSNGGQWFFPRGLCVVRWKSDEHDQRESTKDDLPADWR